MPAEGALLACHQGLEQITKYFGTITDYSPSNKKNVSIKSVKLPDAIAGVLVEVRTQGSNANLRNTTAAFSF